VVLCERRYQAQGARPNSAFPGRAGRAGPPPMRLDDGPCHKWPLTGAGASFATRSAPGVVDQERERPGKREVYRSRRAATAVHAVERPAPTTPAMARAFRPNATSFYFAWAFFCLHTGSGRRFAVIDSSTVRPRGGRPRALPARWRMNPWKIGQAFRHVGCPNDNAPHELCSAGL
jgi:hypothetical protein